MHCTFSLHFILFVKSRQSAFCFDYSIQKVCSTLCKIAVFFDDIFQRSMEESRFLPGFPFFFSKVRNKNTYSVLRKPERNRFRPGLCPVRDRRSSLFSGYFSMDFWTVVFYNNAVTGYRHPALIRHCQIQEVSLC